LLKDRIVFIAQIDDHRRRRAAPLPANGRRERTSTHINSPGGSVTAGLFDTMGPDLRCDHLLLGMAASMGAVLLCAGTKANVSRSRIPTS
jgi:ATP-dependent Clp protease protease subunit